MKKNVDHNDYRVVVLDDDRNFLNLIRAILSAEQIVCDVFEDYNQAMDYLKKLSVQQTPTCFIIDLDLAKYDGLLIAKEVINELAIPVALVTSDRDIMKALNAFDIGVYDFLLKPVKTERLFSKTKEMLAKSAAKIAEKCNQPAIDVSLLNLTQKEIGVIQLLIDGFSVAKIAQQLSVSENTVKYHKKNIYSKFYLSSHPELISKKDEILDAIAYYSSRL